MHQLTWYPLLILGTLVLPLASDAQEPQATVREIATLRGVDVDQAVRLPNGRVILYSVGDGTDHLTIFAYELDARRATLVARGTWPDLAVSRAGDRIVYSVPSADSTAILWSMPINPASGAAAGTAIRLSAGDGQTAAFSPDGKSLVFEHHRAPAGSDLVLVPADGGTERVLAGFESGIGGMSWSDDGNSVYVRVGKQPSTVQRVPVAGGPAQQVMSFPATRGGSISMGDGQLALYFADRQSGAKGHLSYATSAGTSGELAVPPGSNLGTYVDLGSPKLLLITVGRIDGTTTSTIYELDLTPILRQTRKR